MSKKQEVIDIVIPYKITADGGQELKFALRSIEKNFVDPHRVVIIGDLPDWVNADALLHIPTDIMPRDENPKAWNIIEKMKIIANRKEISKTFLISYDDIIFASEVCIEDIATPVAVAPMPENENFKTDASDAWKVVFINTLKALRRNKLPMFNYETHLPRAFEKKKLADLFVHFGFEKRPYCFPTLYFNYFDAKPFVLVDNPDHQVKIGIATIEDFHENKNQFGEYYFVNWKENMWGDDIRLELEDMFPNPSKYEKPAIRAEQNAVEEPPNDMPEPEATHETSGSEISEN